MSNDQRVYTISDSHWTGISCSCCNGARAKRGKKAHDSQDPRQDKKADNKP